LKNYNNSLIQNIARVKNKKRSILIWEK
jgi:hypothetical protein